MKGNTCACLLSKEGRAAMLSRLDTSQSVSLRFPPISPQQELPIAAAVLRRPPPNVFNANDEPMLSEAFASAWRVLTAEQTDSESDPGSIPLQFRIASAVMIAASMGIKDPALVAKAAIERCSSTRSL